RKLPQSLVSSEVLDSLIALLLEKEALRRSLKVRNFGRRVTDEGEAGRLFAGVARVTREVLGLDDADLPEPELVLTERLSQLTRQIVKLCLLVLPAYLFLFYYAFRQSGGGAAIWVVRIAILSLLVSPLIFHRRVRLNIEHGCGYSRNMEGPATIIIDQLPAIQFQSYVAHEYAHHLYFQHFEGESKEWVREGWARLVQWRVAEHLYHQEDDPAYLYHVLVQTIGELKFACQMISMTLHRKLPLRVRLIRTLYNDNPLFRLLTGTPGFNVTSLIDHAIGTACYFLAEQRFGFEETLWGSPPSL
ncbi:MAG: hypothetical protein IMF10_01230, partial [Proteobacteria bacterium]|nr:hypothetical protein [Pseudomonadota bacterium]